MLPDLTQMLDFMMERHNIYIKRKNGEPQPWTDDPILRKYKFTNVFRELDRTTVWMRENLVGPCTDKEPGDLILFNACVFRRFGTIEFSQKLGFIKKWEPAKVMKLANDLLAKGEKVFTGAYNIPNMGLTLPKTEVVVYHTLDPIWKEKKRLAEIAIKTRTLEDTHKALFRFPSWGGSGFMAYEVVSDLRWSSLLRTASDIKTWANPGVGARRGLNRLYGRDYQQQTSAKQCLLEMREIFPVLYDVWESLGGGDWGHLEFRELEHSLCELDKYLRTKLGQGRPKATFKPNLT